MSRKEESCPIDIKPAGNIPGEYYVQSRSQPRLFHLVRLTNHGDSCPCRARVVCAHIKACRAMGLAEMVIPEPDSKLATTLDRIARSANVPSLY